MKNVFEKDLQNILTALLKYRPEKIILFGSAAKGKFSPESDLDLFIVKKTKKRFVDRIEEVLGLMERIKIPVDAVVYTPEEFLQAQKDNRMFIEEVLETGRILYEAA